MKKRVLKHSLADHVYTTIKNSIIDFERKPGEKLNIDELSKTLKVSNTPIREAIRRLQQEGLTEQKNNVGFYVKKITKEESEKYSEIIKIAMLGSIDELVFNGNIKNLVDELEEQLKLQIGFFEKKDSINFLKEAINFDQLFIKFLGNDILINQVKNLNGIFAFAVFEFHSKDKNKEKSIEDHKRIIQAVKDEDFDKLKRIIRDHYILGTSKELYEKGLPPVETPAIDKE